MSGAILLVALLAADPRPSVQVYEDGSVLIRSGPAASTPATPQQGNAAHEPAVQLPEAQHIDIDVVNADVRGVLRLIADVSHLNFVLDDAVHGTVTTTLRDVPWDQALAAILQSQGLVAVPFGEEILVVQPAP